MEKFRPNRFRLRKILFLRNSILEESSFVKYVYKICKTFYWYQIYGRQKAVVLLVLKYDFGSTKIGNTAQKMRFSIKDFFSKCDQIRRKLSSLSVFAIRSLDSVSQDSPK